MNVPDPVSNIWMREALQNTGLDLAYRAAMYVSGQEESGGDDLKGPMVFLEMPSVESCLGNTCDAT